MRCHEPHAPYGKQRTISCDNHFELPNWIKLKLNCIVFSLANKQAEDTQTRFNTDQTEVFPGHTNYELTTYAHTAPVWRGLESHLHCWLSWFPSLLLLQTPWSWLGIQHPQLPSEREMERVQLGGKRNLAFPPLRTDYVVNNKSPQDKYRAAKK